MVLKAGSGDKGEVLIEATGDNFWTWENRNLGLKYEFISPTLIFNHCVFDEI
jgi:hypothetical protein